MSISPELNQDMHHVCCVVMDPRRELGLFEMV
jgi:hypothetical protein